MEPRLADVTVPFHWSEGGLTAVLQELNRAIHDLGVAHEDRCAVPRAIAVALAADWIAFREGGGEWTGLAPGRQRVRFPAGEATRRVDFGLLVRLPRDRLVHLAGPALERSPRIAGGGLSEALVYVESARSGPGSAVVIALGRPLTADREVLDAIFRAWFGLAALRSRIAHADEHDQQQELESRAACALHDLRHELTVSTLELDRAAAEPALARGGFDRVRKAIARARALCESELGLTSGVHSSAIRVAELLRAEGSAAHSVSGRGDSIMIEVRCEAGLEFPVDRGMLARIVRNLVLNAIENSPDGERVLIEAEKGPQDHIIVRVTDQGRGMSAEDREELSRFGRSGRGGSGIGSASIATCVRSIGARAKVDSRLGDGTCVELFVPPASGNASPRRPTPQNPLTHASTRG